VLLKVSSYPFFFRRGVYSLWKRKKRKEERNDHHQQTHVLFSFGFLISVFMFFIASITLLQKIYYIFNLVLQQK